ncbi:MAG: hypothetical protein Tsb0033_05450 [Winogradskyella sp.]
MNTITRLVVYAIISLTFTTTHAQEKATDSLKKTSVDYKIEALEEQKIKIEKEEKDFLRQEIEAINERLDAKQITAAEAEELKKEAAKKRAANIENRLAIIDNKIALISRNDSGYSIMEDDGGYISISFGNNDEDSQIIMLGKKNKPKKFDRRTTSDLVFAIGFNNAIIEGQDFDDSPYKLGGSGFVELGYAWKTRIFDNSNFWRLKYGFSFQWNKFDIKDNQYFLNTDGEVTLQEFPVELNKAKFRTTNLVFPVHLEFGPSKKIEKEDYFRYSTRNQFKVGLGGYAGLNIGSMQKLKYKEDGNRIKNKQRGGFEVNEFVYGLSGYLAWGDTALYVKYDLNPLFKDQAFDQNNISVGLRFDMD